MALAARGHDGDEKASVATDRKLLGVGPSFHVTPPPPSRPHIHALPSRTRVAPQGSAVAEEPRRELIALKGVSPKSIEKLDQRLRTGGMKQRKQVFREFLQDVIRKANPGQHAGPRKPTIAELPERLIIRRTLSAQRVREDPLPFEFPDDDL